MGYNLVANLGSCHIDIPNLLYYSHIPTAIIILLFGIFVLFNGKENKLAGKTLFAISVVFFVWVCVEGLLWFLYSSVNMMFLWSFLGLLYAIINVLSIYFVYAVIDKKDISIKKKLIFVFLLLPLIFLMPTHYNLTGFDAVNCQALEGRYFIYYRYFVGIASIIWIIILLFLRYTKAIADEKKQVLLLGFGVLFFLLLFSWTEIMGSLTENFEVTQYGLFGTPILVGFLAYLIVKYRTFKIKLLGAQALVVTLILLIGSQFFFANNSTSIVLTGITLSLSLGFGYILIKSINRENERKEQLQIMADKLAMANDELRKLDNAKTEFISIASHQLRTPLTAIKGFLSLILEGTYGDINDQVRGALDKVYLSSEHLIQLVEDLLNVSRIESGRMQFTMGKADMAEIIDELHANFSLVAKTKKLYLEVKIPAEKLPEVVMDKGKIREVISNLVDNALKYTERGGVVVAAEIVKRGTIIAPRSGLTAFSEKGEPIDSDVLRVTVSDTGVGIPAEEMPYLFKKFSRGKDIARLHVGGTGLGIYVAKNIMTAHHGRIWVESEGAGKGSRFIVELPIA